MKKNKIAIGLVVAAFALGSQAQTPMPLAVNPVVLPAPAPVTPPTTIAPPEKPRAGKPVKASPRHGMAATRVKPDKVAKSDAPAKASRAGRPVRADRSKPSGKKHR